eukprot:g12428.t1
MGQCLRTLGISSSEPYDELQNSNLPIVTLDKRWKGKDVTISNFTVAGKGIALCTAAIHQSRAYYEVTIKKDGDICIGVSQRSKKLNGHLGDIKRKSWGMRSNGRFKEDDVIGVGIDLDTSSLTFFHNGKQLDNDKVRGLMGLCYPAISVSGGGKVECNFSQSFTHDPKDIGLFGYDGIIPARDVL